MMRLLRRYWVAKAARQGGYVGPQSPATRPEREFLGWCGGEQFWARTEAPAPPAPPSQ